MTTLREGAWEMELTGDLERRLVAGLDSATLKIFRQMQEQHRFWLRHAKEGMPVKTGRTRDNVSGELRILSDGAIAAKIRTPRWTRYIFSTQIATERLHGGYIARDEARGIGDPEGKRKRVQDVAEMMGKANRKASRRGSAMWLLVRWPEAYWSQKLLAQLGPLLQQQMQQEVNYAESAGPGVSRARISGLPASLQASAMGRIRGG